VPSERFAQAVPLVPIARAAKDPLLTMADCTAIPLLELQADRLPDSKPSLKIAGGLTLAETVAGADGVLCESTARYVNESAPV
jgi:hypothetical protein